MKLPFTLCTRLAALALATKAFGIEGTSSPYSDAIGDIDPLITTAGGTLDILGMEVSNTATDIRFKLTVGGDVSGTDWGKFFVGIATAKTPGTTSGNAEGRPINLDLAIAPVGMNYWIGSWVDGTSQAAVGGTYLSEYNNSTPGWELKAETVTASLLPSFTYTVTPGAQSTLEWLLPLSTLNIAPGDTIFFDAYSSGGGGADSAIDSLANPNISIASWGSPYTSSPTLLSGNGLNSYTLAGGAAVPEPAGSAVALGGLALAAAVARGLRAKGVK